MPTSVPPPMQHIILSPHYDDAALSCGGMIAQLTAAGDQVVVATVFGGRADPATLSPFARSIHARPGASDDLIAQRAAEEKHALAILGAQSRPGSYLDCIYRQVEPGGRWLYDREEALFGPVDAADAALVEELAAVFAVLAPHPNQCTIYAPLAIGCHVDHQVVQQAALKLLEAGYSLLFYEDYPYVVRDPADLPAALARIKTGGGWQPQPVALSRQELDRKIAAVSAYASQLGVLFGTDGVAAPQDVAGALDGFARYTAHGNGSGRFAERFWAVAQAV
ncbi:MAG: PIG-L family deacetylase [Caldilineales bacterium]